MPSQIQTSEEGKENLICLVPSHKSVACLLAFFFGGSESWRKETSEVMLS